MKFALFEFDLLIIIKAMEVRLFNSAGTSTRKTCGGVIFGSWRIFFLSWLALYSFISHVIHLRMP
jgi:hypothetical protein